MTALDGASAVLKDKVGYSLQLNKALAEKVTEHANPQDPRDLMTVRAAIYAIELHKAMVTLIANGQHRPAYALARLLIESSITALYMLLRISDEHAAEVVNMQRFIPDTKEMVAECADIDGYGPNLGKLWKSMKPLHKLTHGDTAQLNRTACEESYSRDSIMTLMQADVAMLSAVESAACACLDTQLQAQVLTLRDAFASALEDMKLTEERPRAKLPLPPRMRPAAESDWVLSETLGSRRERLHAPIQPEMLLRRVSRIAVDAARAQTFLVNWELSEEKPPYGRINAQLPLDEITFDQLVNGRSGYRAQYFNSPTEGLRFDKEFMQAIRPALDLFWTRSRLEVDFEIVLRSLYGPYSKISIYCDQSSTDDAPAFELLVARWMSNKAIRGLRAPLPSHLTIDIKGTFVCAGSDQPFIDDMKLDRPNDMHTRGYA